MKPLAALWSRARTLPVILALALLAGCQGGAGDVEVVEIGGEAFRLEVAADEPTRTRGLMHREAIDPGGGMLFVFPRSEERAFWMGNCLVDIDIIFLDPQGRVTAVHTMKAEAPKKPEESDAAYRARMPSYSSVYPAMFAIELKADTAKRLGVRVEDRIDLDVRRLKRRVQ